MMREEVIGAAGRDAVSKWPCPSLRPKRSAYGLAGRSSGQRHLETGKSVEKGRNGGRTATLNDLEFTKHLAGKTFTQNY
jgi:hypothetical protein